MLRSLVQSFRGEVAPVEVDRAGLEFSRESPVDAGLESDRLIEPLRQVVEGAWDLSRSFPAGAGLWGRIGRLLNALFKKLAQAITRYAADTIRLSKIAPELESLSAQLSDTAQAQAARATEISEAVTRLHQASGQLTGIVAMIERTATQIKILSINASIEASRAGVQGLAFGVLAEEIGKLSRQTMEATGKVSRSLDVIKTEIEKTA
jgi:methyl-accepting chemotaxis protein